MQQPYIELRERRELGEILSDSFTILRINKTQLWNVLVKTSGIFFLLSVLLAGLYQYATISSWMTEDSLSFFLVLFLMIFSGMLFYASISAGIYTLMQNYIDTKGNIQEEIVVQEARSKIGQLILLTVISAFIMFFGFIFFIIPGFYIAVPMTLVFPIFCFQKLGKRDSIREAFRLVSGYWWVTFGTILVIYIVFMIISFVFQIPSTAYLAAKSFVTASGGDASMSGDFLYLILATVSSAAGNLISIPMTIAFGLIYFDLDEEKNRTGIKAKLEELG